MRNITYVFFVVFACSLGTQVLTHAQCVLQTCHKCGVHSVCEIGIIEDMHNVTSCINLIDNTTVLAVEYRPSQNRCISASCPQLSYSSSASDTRSYVYTCQADCEAFTFDLKIFTMIEETPSLVVTKTSTTSCLAVCLNVSCWMYDATLTECRIYSQCGPTHDCTITSSLTTWTYLRTCIPDCGAPLDVADGTVSYEGTIVNDVATYTCNPGYNLTGESISVCQNTSTWSIDPPSCLSTTTTTTTTSTTSTTSSTSTSTTSTSSTNSSTTTSTTVSTTTPTTSPTTTTTTESTTVSTTSSTTASTTSPTATTTTESTTSSSSTISTTSSTGTSTYNKSEIKPLYIWPCLCNKNSSIGQMNEDDFLKQYVEGALIDRTSTTMFVNKRVCKTDRRMSANAIGAVGSLVLVTMLCILILCDISKYLSKRHENIDKQT